MKITQISCLLSLALITNGLPSDQKIESLLSLNTENLSDVTPKQILIPDGHGSVKYVDLSEIKNTLVGASYQYDFHAYEDVRFLLYTRANPTNAQEIKFRDVKSLLASNYDGHRPTRVLIHGFRGDENSDVNKLLTAAYLRNSDMNIIVVDWRSGADTLNYFAARNRVFEVGPLLGEFLDFLNKLNNLNFEQLTVVGHSLGAHIAGSAGKTVKRGRINTIIGLDPAGPLFNLHDKSNRLDFSDAHYVESIHTDSLFGIAAAISHADFFANNGKAQPGCFTSLCDHGRSVELFAESINSNRLIGRRCLRLTDILHETTCKRESAVMGDPSNAKNNLRGIFQVITNSESPFGRG